MMKIKNILFLSLLTIFAFCKSQQTSASTAKEEPPKKFENSVYNLDNDDKEMLHAIEIAKSTFSEFEKAITSKNPNFKNFSLKKAYKSPYGYEQIWIAFVVKRPNSTRYVGIIGNEPQFTKEVKFDDIVELETEEVTDWMYLDNHIVRGAYTLHVLRDRMSPDARKAFDAESGFVFE